MCQLNKENSPAVSKLLAVHHVYVYAFGSLHFIIMKFLAIFSETKIERNKIRGNRFLENFHKCFGEHLRHINNRKDIIKTKNQVSSNLNHWQTLALFGRIFKREYGTFERKRPAIHIHVVSFIIIHFHFHSQ